MTETSKQYTVFVTTEGHYEYNRMPFGLANAPAVSQDLMNKIISKMKRVEAMSYLDDVIIPSNTVEYGIERLDKFLSILQEYGLTLYLKKCSFLATEIMHLGHILNAEGITPGQSKVFRN